MVPPTETPRPPCHVTKSLSPPYAGPVSFMLSASVGVVTLIEANTMQTGMEQPAQDPRPTVLVLLIVKLNEKYSWLAFRSWSAFGGTAMAATRRAVFGPRWPTLYAPTSPAEFPCAQS